MSDNKRDNIKLSYQIVKSSAELKKIILTNVIKMLTNRGLFNITDLDSNINKLLSQNPTTIYEIDTTKHEHEYEKKFIIYLTNNKLSSVSKGSNINNFLTKNKYYSKIIIATEANSKAMKTINENFLNSEVFTENELLIDKINHELQPKFYLLSKQESIDLMKEYYIKRENLPNMLYYDPIRKYYNANRGDIFRIVDGFSIRYRVVK
jgi:DNA-directed RNA polymerase subunit H (RpoH/RPB5)